MQRTNHLGENRKPMRAGAGGIDLSFPVFKQIYCTARTLRCFVAALARDTT
jgi:hypothetical protein